MNPATTDPVQHVEPTEPSRTLQTTVIRPAAGWHAVDFRELWRFRALLLMLTWRDIKIRYKQTILGPIWALIPPIMSTGAFTLLFGMLMGQDGRPTVPGIHYALSTFCAMLPWRLFSGALTGSGNSLVAAQNIITKVYFPRLTLPLAAILSGLFDFVVALPILIIMMIYWQVVPTLAILTFPLFILFAIVAAVALGLWVAPLAAVFRDFRLGLPFAVQFLMYLSPVIYPAAKVRETCSDWVVVLYSLNPLVGIIEGCRWALLGPAAQPPAIMLIPSIAMTCLLLIGGLFFFHRMEGNLIDVI